MGSKPLFDLVKERRTIYSLSHESPIPDAKIQEIVTETIRNVPSAFNSQSTRLVLILGKEHQKLWDTITDVYRQMLPAESFEKANQRFPGFRAGYGTILFYEDQATVIGMQQNISAYADYFPQWSEHTNAMHQFVLWTALEAEGFGANLQHYQPPIESPLAKEYGLPEAWKLKSQLVFGKPTGGPAQEKTFKPIEERLKVFGASG